MAAVWVASSHGVQSSLHQPEAYHAHTCPFPWHSSVAVSGGSKHMSVQTEHMPVQTAPLSQSSNPCCGISASNCDCWMCLESRRRIILVFVQVAVG